MMTMLAGDFSDVDNDSVHDDDEDDNNDDDNDDSDDDADDNNNNDDVDDDNNDDDDDDVDENDGCNENDYFQNSISYFSFHYLPGIVLMVGEVDTNEMVSDSIHCVCMSCSIHSISIHKRPAENDGDNSFTSVIGGLSHTTKLYLLNRLIQDFSNKHSVFI